MYSNLLDLMKNVGGIIGLGASIISGIALLRNSLIPGSVRSAREIIERASDPSKKFNSHFNQLIDKIKSPILVLIDDLDRCKENYVVEFLEGIHTIFKGTNVFYIIMADQRWIFRSYESIYQTFVNLDEESGRPLGYLFTDKVFQLLVPLPKLSGENQKDYFNYILLNKSPEEVTKAVDNKLNTAKTPNEIINIVNKGIDFSKDNVSKLRFKSFAY
jgi:KAP family P-loop domain